MTFMITSVVQQIESWDGNKTPKWTVNGTCVCGFGANMEWMQGIRYDEGENAGGSHYLPRCNKCKRASAFPECYEPITEEFAMAVLKDGYCGFTEVYRSSDGNTYKGKRIPTLGQTEWQPFGPITGDNVLAEDRLISRTWSLGNGKVYPDASNPDSIRLKHQDIGTHMNDTNKNGSIYYLEGDVGSPYDLRVGGTIATEATEAGPQGIGTYGGSTLAGMDALVSWVISQNKAAGVSVDMVKKELAEYWTQQARLIAAESHMLDTKGLNMGINRLPGETNDVFRQRLKQIDGTAMNGISGELDMRGILIQHDIGSGKGLDCKDGIHSESKLTIGSLESDGEIRMKGDCVIRGDVVIKDCKIVIEGGNLIVDDGGSLVMTGNTVGTSLEDGKWPLKNDIEAPNVPVEGVEGKILKSVDGQLVWTSANEEVRAEGHIDSVGVDGKWAMIEKKLCKDVFELLAEKMSIEPSQIIRKSRNVDMFPEYSTVKKSVQEQPVGLRKELAARTKENRLGTEHILVWDLVILAQDEVVGVREIVARNEKTPIHVLKMLALDVDETVRSVALERLDRMVYLGVDGISSDEVKKLRGKPVGWVMTEEIATMPSKEDLETWREVFEGKDVEVVMHKDVISLDEMQNGIEEPAVLKDARERWNQEWKVRGAAMKSIETSKPELPSQETASKTDWSSIALMAAGCVAGGLVSKVFEQQSGVRVENTNDDIMDDVIEGLADTAAKS
jgi:hypothetical protein